MNLEYRQGNILNAERGAIAIPINCKGAHGAGLAKQWAHAFPDAASKYRRLCAANLIIPGWPRFMEFDGSPLVSATDGAMHFVLFPTKDDWRKPSQLEWITKGLGRIAAKYDSGLHRGPIHLPPLGCGLGGLEVADFREAVRTQFRGCPVNITLWTPE